MAKKSKWNNPDLEKENIISNVKLYRDGEKSLKNQIIKDIEDFAKKKHVELKKEPIILDLKVSLLYFIENKSGYNVTLPQLYNSMKNGI